MATAAQATEFDAEPDGYHWSQTAMTLTGVLLGGAAAITVTTLLRSGGLPAAIGVTLGSGLVSVCVMAPALLLAVQFAAARDGASVHRGLRILFSGAALIVTAVLAPLLASTIALAAPGAAKDGDGAFMQLAKFAHATGLSAVPLAGAAGALLAWAIFAPAVLHGIRAAGARAHAAHSGE